MPNILGLEEFSQLEPVAPTVCDTNNDQRVYESDSPKSLLDLDSISGHQSFYGDEPALNIKIEKDLEHVSYSCSMHNINSSYQMYNPSQILVKEEPEPVEDIGTSVIRHLKEEINNTCCILRISTGKLYFNSTPKMIDLHILTYFINLNTWPILAFLCWLNLLLLCRYYQVSWIYTFLTFILFISQMTSTCKTA